MNKKYSLSLSGAKDLLKDFGTDIENLELSEETKKLFLELGEIVNLEDEKEIDRLFTENEMTYSTIQVKKIKNEIAKECAKDIFPLQNIHEHQVEFMRQYEEQGGISFLLIYFTSRHVCYYMSFQEMMKYWNRAKEGGVKHFKYEELDIGFFVPLKQGMILHYLECLQKVLEQKDQ